jgi:hypothetical protein
VSGPVDDPDSPVAADPATQPGVEITESRAATVGRMTVRRALPRRGRRTVGAWCFVDHMGPAAVTEDEGIDIGPHPHTGLQTVTWLVAGEVLHRDSLGSEQVVRPGQLNLMSAGRGVAHSEEHTGRYRGDLHGVQLWVAQPDETRGGEPAFEHHAELPMVEVGGCEVTVLVGALAGATSPARRDTDHLGADLVVRGTSVLPVDTAHEHALVVLDGTMAVAGEPVGPGHLAHLGPGRSEVEVRALDGPARAILLGGTPFAEELVMWWNFVARSRVEISDAFVAWMDGDEGRFGTVRSPLERIPVGPPPWLTGPR